jgi:hypothetical protein
VASRLGEEWKKEEAPVAQSPRDAAYQAAIWVDAMKMGRQMRSDPALAATYFEVRYEALVAEPRATLEPLFTFLGEPWSDTVLRYHEVERQTQGVEEWSAEQVTKPLYDSAIGRWRKEMTPAQSLAVETVAGADLRELGYLPP